MSRLNVFLTLEWPLKTREMFYAGCTAVASLARGRLGGALFQYLDVQTP